MAAKRQPKTKKKVATLTHGDASRKNIPTAELQSVMEKSQQSPVRVAMERRNRDLDPQLVWRGKDLQDWADLVVQAPPLYIQEKVHPKVLIDDLLNRSATDAKADEPQEKPRDGHFFCTWCLGVRRSTPPPFLRRSHASPRGQGGSDLHLRLIVFLCLNFPRII